MKCQKNKEKYIAFNGKKYAFSLEGLRNAYQVSSSGNGGLREYEITEQYEPDQRGSMTKTTRIERESKQNKNPQDDAMVHEIIKLVIIALLENSTVEDEFRMDMGTALALNTLISWGILIEITEQE